VCTSVLLVCSGKSASVYIVASCSAVVLGLGIYQCIDSKMCVILMMFISSVAVCIFHTFTSCVAIGFYRSESFMRHQ
jgi:hypothetical protein